jgi:hypothetical protein
MDIKSISLKFQSHMGHAHYISWEISLHKKNNCNQISNQAVNLYN